MADGSCNSYRHSAVDTSFGLKMDSIISKTIAFVKNELKGNDASHDWSHIERVWKVAKQIGLEEKVDDLEIVELGALLHDIADWKYSGSDTLGAELAVKFLAEQGYPQDKIDVIQTIITCVGFKEELSAGRKVEIFPALACVQDADRLDAIGAIGIARCFTYGGSRSRPLYDSECPPRPNMTKEEYMATGNSHPSINHFHEKLLLLRDMMKTGAGRRMADGRHAFMVQYLSQFENELSGLQ